MHSMHGIHEYQLVDSSQVSVRAVHNRLNTCWVHTHKLTLCILTNRSVYNGFIHTAVNISEQRLQIRTIDWFIQYSLLRYV